MGNLESAQISQADDRPDNVIPLFNASTRSGETLPGIGSLSDMLVFKRGEKIPVDSSDVSLQDTASISMSDIIRQELRVHLNPEQRTSDISFNRSLIVPEIAKKLISDEELEGRFDTDPILKIQDLLGKKVQFPLTPNSIFPGRVGLISQEKKIAHIFYSEQSFAIMPFTVLKVYNPQLFSLLSFK